MSKPALLIWDLKARNPEAHKELVAVPGTWDVDDRFKFHVNGEISRYSQCTITGVWVKIGRFRNGTWYVIPGV